MLIIKRAETFWDNNIGSKVKRNGTEGVIMICMGVLLKHRITTIRGYPNR